MLRPVNREESYQGETKCIPTTSKRFDSVLNAHYIVEDSRNVGEMKSNEPGRQKLDRLGRGPVSKYSMQRKSYIRTYYMLRKTEPVIAMMGSHQGRRGLHFCIRGTLPASGDPVAGGGGGGGRFEHPRVAEVVPNCSIYLRTTRAVCCRVYNCPTIPHTRRGGGSQDWSVLA